MTLFLILLLALQYAYVALKNYNGKYIFKSRMQRDLIPFSVYIVLIGHMLSKLKRL